MDGLQVKEKMTIEELKERLKEVCKVNGWNADGVLDFYFDDSNLELTAGSRDDIVRGFIYAMFCSGIITFVERNSFVNSIFENKF